MLLEKGIAPSEMNHWTVDQFDLFRRWVDEAAARKGAPE